MPLALTAYGIAQGYSLSKLCDITYSVGNVQSSNFITPRSGDINDGYYVNTTYLPNNSNNQPVPLANGITGTSPAPGSVFAGDRVNSYSGNHPSIPPPTILQFYRAINNTTPPAVATALVSHPDAIFYQSGLVIYGLADRQRQKAYAAISTGGIMQILEIDAQAATVGTFLNYGSISGTGVNAMAFYDADNMLFSLSQSGTNFVQKVDLSGSVVQTWTFPALNLSTFPYTVFRGIGVLQGNLAGKWLFSCSKRFDAGFTQALAILEFDATIPVTEASFNEVAVGEQLSFASWEITSLLAFGENFVLQADRGAGGIGGRIARLTLPPGSDADNNRPPTPTPPTPPTPPDDGWTRTVPGVATNWDESCRPEEITWTEDCRPPVVQWSQRDF